MFAVYIYVVLLYNTRVFSISVLSLILHRFNVVIVGYSQMLENGIQYTYLQPKEQNYV